MASLIDTRSGAKVLAVAALAFLAACDVGGGGSSPGSGKAPGSQTPPGAGNAPNPGDGGGAGTDGEPARATPAGTDPEDGGTAPGGTTTGGGGGGGGGGGTTPVTPVTPPVPPPPPPPTKPCNGARIPVGQECPDPVDPPVRPTTTKDCNGRQIPVDQACPAPVTPDPEPNPPPVTGSGLSPNCPVTLCGVYWTGETAGALDLDAIPWPGGLQYDRDGPPRDPEELYDHDGDPMTPMINRGTAHEPRDVSRYQFQAAYMIREDDPNTNRDEREYDISLIEQDVRYAWYTVDAIADLITIIRTGRDRDALTALPDGSPLIGSEINNYLVEGKDGVPVFDFSRTPVSVIVRARGVSHDLRGAADEDVAHIDTLLDELARYEARAMAAKAEVTRLRNAEGADQQVIRRLSGSESEIDYWLARIAARAPAAEGQQMKDKAALDGLPDDLENVKATVIRTMLESIANDTSGTVRFAKDGNLADLDSAANAAGVFARRPDPTGSPALYADYGMWLDGTDATPALETRMGLVDPDGVAGTADLTTAGTEDSGLAATATYRGETRGLSARTANGVTASGHFRASVTLNATFGDAPTLGGTIRNFRTADAGQGTAHVGSWTVDLADTDPGTGDISDAPFDRIGAAGRPTGGGWSAYAYGPDSARPTGFYGGFEADFADGAAVGQFDARK